MTKTELSTIFEQFGELIAVSIWPEDNSSPKKGRVQFKTSEGMATCLEATDYLHATHDIIIDKWIEKSDR